ncbi:deaminase domain-containing protein [Streptomyces sp. 8K308]|uniref:deaminase domain-containing protein n=1 Tax=Streptomyces sp. 8K308 TaxID=2530388 RepID=UPI0014047A1A|nr:deaminase domain-containing protein [Streptomyces sp. 8K308]
MRTAIRTASRAADHWSAVQRARRTLDRYEDLIQRLRNNPCRIGVPSSGVTLRAAENSLRTSPISGCLIRDAARALRDALELGGDRNVGVADVDIFGIGLPRLFSVSGRGDRYEGLVPWVGDPRNPQRFLPRQLEGEDNDRTTDTEYRLLTYIANQIGEASDDVDGVIDLYTELPVCNSCNDVINQFRNEFPNVTVNVTHG